jgi:hypothetical protein
VASPTPRPLYLRQSPGTHCTGGWVGPRAGLDGCGKSRPHRDSNPRPSSPQQSLYLLRCPGPLWRKAIHKNKRHLETQRHLLDSHLGEFMGQYVWVTRQFCVKDIATYWPPEQKFVILILLKFFTILLLVMLNLYLNKACSNSAELLQYIYSPL